MKNNLLTILSAILIGFLLTKFTFNQYETDHKIKTVFNASEEVTFLKLGVFDNLDEIQSKEYIYNVQDEKYHVYIGITKDKNNIQKIKDYYKQEGYDITESIVTINNKEFINILKQYDTLLKEIDDEQVLISVCSSILSKYKELVINESTN